MRGYSICFFGEKLKIIPKVSLLPILPGALHNTKIPNFSSFRNLVHVVPKLSSFFATPYGAAKPLSPVVQSIIGLMSSLSGQLVKCITTL